MLTTADISRRPEHVPLDLVCDFDIYRFPVQDGDLHSGLLALRQAGMPEIFWTPRNGGHWIATRGQDIQFVLETPEIFSSRKSSVPKELAPNPPLPPIQSDSPEHDQYRRLLSDAFSARSVRLLEHAARTLTIELVEALEPRGSCEFIGEFATHLPIEIFMSIVDLPSADRLELLQISENCMRPTRPEDRVAAFIALGQYARQKVEERRVKPGSDLISTILAARVDGKPLTDDQVTRVITLVLTAGLDTVASMLGFVICFLARNAELRAQLISSPQLIPRAAEEMLRRHAIATLAREVTSDIVLGSTALKAGDMIVLPTLLGNLDEQIFENPLEIDIYRRPQPHFTFGAGPHRCIGANLARAELRIFLEEWLPRIPDFAIDPDATLTIEKRVVATLTSIPLVWTPRAQRSSTTTKAR